jgi:hypothetical protein
VNAIGVSEHRYTSIAVGAAGDHRQPRAISQSIPL